MSLEIRNLTHTYGEDSPFEYKALKDINLTIEDGAFIGLIGHTGSGKSTLIQHLNGLLTPTSGTVVYQGRDIFAGTKKDMLLTRQQIGMVFQYPEHQLFEESVAKDVAFGPKNIGLGEAEIDERVREAIAWVGLDYDTIAEKSPFDLSGGQMRRVAIAGVLAMRPEVLILDEPTAGLDPRGRDEILNLIADFHREQKITVILVSHSMDDVGRFADKVIVMADGAVIFYDTPREVFTHVEALETIGLAAPAAVYLLRRLKECYPDIRQDVLTPAEAVAEILRVKKEADHA